MTTPAIMKFNQNFEVHFYQTLINSFFHPILFVMHAFSCFSPGKQRKELVHIKRVQHKVEGNNNVNDQS